MMDQPTLTISAAKNGYFVSVNGYDSAEGYVNHTYVFAELGEALDFVRRTLPTRGPGTTQG